MAEAHCLQRRMVRVVGGEGVRGDGVIVRGEGVVVRVLWRVPGFVTAEKCEL